VSSPEPLLVGLSPDSVVLARQVGRWRKRLEAGERIACGDPSNEVAERPWEAALAALAQALGRADTGPGSLQVVLAGRLVRWQLLPWRPELKGPRELATYAGLRFRETYGRCAESWRVSCSPQLPGRAIPACAVDGGLVDGLNRVSQAAGLRLGRVTPYYAAAFDNWRDKLPRETAWFGLVEPDCLSLGLVRDGSWLALRSERLGRSWPEAVAATMAQLSIATGLDTRDAPLFLTGGNQPALAATDLRCSWLSPREPGLAEAHWRLALGV
jgi:hypothetical protein